MCGSPRTVGDRLPMRAEKGCFQVSCSSDLPVFQRLLTVQYLAEPEPSLFFLFFFFYFLSLLCPSVVPSRVDQIRLSAGA